MEIDLYIFSQQKLSSIPDWQTAINNEGYDLRILSPLPFQSLSGYTPVRWRESDVGIDCFHIERDKVPPLFEGYDAFPYVLGLRWQENYISQFAAYISALAYAKSTSGLIFLCSDRNLLKPEEFANLLTSAEAGLPRYRPTTLLKGGAKYNFDERPSTIISASSAEALQQLRDAEYAVLVGRNNCGKSFVLKTLTQHWGENASYIGPARYQNFNLLGYYTPTRSRKLDKWNQFIGQWNNNNLNIDNSPLNLQQAIAEMKDWQRKKLSEIVKILLNTDLDIRNTVEDNDMSQKYISCGGHNISFTSSGFRLIAALITSLLDTDYDTILIDEPELGISPEAQGVLADFLFDSQHRKKYFGHIKTLILATHSTIFLDRKNIRNNYIVEKDGDEISLSRVEIQHDFNGIHFFLLGNRFETLYLPSSIFLVEGKSDHKFIERALSLRFPNGRISVISTNSDGRVKETLHIAKGLLHDIQRSPYHDRIFVVLDSLHSKGLPAEIEAMGIPKENIIIWPKNGIEYFYPESVLDEIFGAGPEIDINGDIISRNGISLTKDALADRVVALLKSDTKMNGDFEYLLINRMNALLS